MTWDARWTRPFENLSMVHDTCHGATCGHTRGVSMEKSMEPSMGRPMIVTMMSIYHDGKSHGRFRFAGRDIVHVCTMGPTLGNPVTLSVQRVPWAAMASIPWRKQYFCGVTYARNVHASIVGHHGTNNKPWLACSIVHPEL